MTESIKSSLTKSSQMTQQLLDDVTEKQSKIKMIQKQGIIDPEILEKAWIGLGIYISKQLRTGRAVSIPKFGLFTFSAPEVSMKGTTNPEERELENREPVFKIYQDIGKGMQIKPAVYKEKGLRPLTVSSTSGKIQTVIISYAEIAQQQSIEKDTVKLAIERIFKKFDENIRSGQETNLLEIPCVGTIIVRHGLGALAFNEFLKSNAIGLLKQNILERKKNIQSNLTNSNINKLIQNQDQNDQIIDEDAQNWLSENLDIQFEADNYSKSSHQKGQKSVQKIKIKKNNDNKYFNNPLLDTKSTQNGYTKMSIAHRDENGNGDKNNNNQFTVESQSLKKIRCKLQINEMPPEESFLNLATGVYGINANQQSLLNKEQFGLALQKQQCDLYDYELDAVFKIIDIKKDFVIDLSEWTQMVCEEKTPQQFLVDVIKINNNDLNKIKQILNVSQDSHPVSQQQLIKILKQLNTQWQNKDLMRIINYIMRGKNKIASDQLLTFFQVQNLKDLPVEDENLIEKQWYNQILKQLKFDIEQKENPDFLIEKFQSFDDKMEGIIDIANFKTCLMQSNLKTLQDQNIFQKFVKGVELDSRQMVNYPDFINSIKNSSIKAEQRGGLEYIAQKIKQVLKEKRLDCRDFFIFLTENQELRKKYNIENRYTLQNDLFAQLLATSVFPIYKKQDVLNYTHIIDVDKDGYIDQYDLETFLGRYGYLESVYLKNNFVSQKSGETPKSKISQSTKGFSKASTPKKNKKYIQDSILEEKEEVQEFDNSIQNSNNTVKSNNTSKLFPTEALSQDKLLTLIKEIKRIVIHKKQSWFEVFKMMDDNNNGFVTLDEFSSGIEKVIKLSKVAKEGLFAYFDNLKIGMFDFVRFKEVMCRIDTNLYATKFEDNWKWQTQVIEIWRKWYKEKKIDIDEAFRLADFDFDGFLSQEDIKKFLIKFLKVREQEIDNVKLQRLFQLCDKLKRGVVQKTDLQYMLENNDNEQKKQMLNSIYDIQNTQTQFSESQGQTSEAKSTLNQHHVQWLESAKLQISMYILKNFKSIDQSFEQISNHSSSLMFKQFKQWLEQNVVLKGYNLTDALLQTLYSYIDPHKKGLLSKNDWQKAFGNVDQKTNIAFDDILSSIYTNFDNYSDTYNYFQNKETKLVDFNQFKQCVKSLFLDIYDLKQISEIWILLCKKQRLPQNYQTQMDRESFKQLFDTSKFKKNGQKNNKKEFQLSSQYIKKNQLNNNNSQQLLGSARNTLEDINSNQSVQLQSQEMPQITSSQNFYKNNSVSQKSKSQQKYFSNSQMFLSKITSPLQSLSKYSTSNSNKNNKFNNKSYQHFQTTEDIYGQLNKLLLASGKNIDFAFQEVDKLNTGEISTMEFKHILMNLNLGLTSKEIGTIIMLNSFNGDQIKWKEFYKKLKLSESEQQLEKRSQNRILELRHDLYTFLISPKDAYRQFDEEKKGKMNFSEFREFLLLLYSRSKKQVPPYAVAKDMFDFIDLKNDGIIDIEEWVQTFARYENNPKPQMNKTLRNSYSLNKTTKKDTNKLVNIGENKNIVSQLNLLEHRFDKPIYKNRKGDNYNTMSYGDHFKNTVGLPLKWERTQQYDQTIRLIGKNRRILADDFKEAGSQGEKMLLHKFKVQGILDRCLKHYNIKVQPQNWEVITHFAQEKDQMINCKFLLEVYKQRLMDFDSQPHNIIKFENQDQLKLGNSRNINISKSNSRYE